MEESKISKENKTSITIKSGSKNKSINNYIKKICRFILEKIENIEIISYGKIIFLNKEYEINKTITILEIIKRAIPELQYENKIFWHIKKSAENKNEKLPGFKSILFLNFQIVENYKKKIEGNFNLIDRINWI